MRNTAKSRLTNLIRKKLSDKRGFSLGELLAATVILLLASQVMTQGMAFATRMYKESLTRSHAKQLCSTLTNVIEKELRYTTSVNADSDGTVLKYFSPTYGKTESAFAAIDENENKIDGTAGGEIAVQLTAEDGSPYWQKLISSASYSSFDLKATIQSVKLEGTTFHVILEITDKDGKKIVTNKFDVIAVNDIKLDQL